MGVGSLQANTTASDNTAVGYQAGYTNTTGTRLSALGYSAGYSQTTGTANVAIGYRALYNNETASDNVAVGNNALFASTGSENTGVGSGVLVSNTTGSDNVAVGRQALTSNTTASNNTAVGYQAGYDNTTGTRITAIGRSVLNGNTTGVDNTGVGGIDASAAATLGNNTTGTNNVAVGGGALNGNISATNSTAIGYRALKASNANNNTAVGQQAGVVATGERNSFFGSESGSLITSGEKNTIIGRFNGNSGGLDIRTSSNNIVLSDGDGNPRIVVNSSGQIKLGGTDQEGHLHVFGNFIGYSAVFHNDGNNANRYGILSKSGSDSAAGTNYAFDIQDGNGTLQGSITFSGGTVTYGAFTAYHPCIIPNADNDADSTANAYPYGTLLEITSIGYTQKDGADTERGIRYNVQKSSSAKSKAVLGAYGSSMNNVERGETNLHQALILGDGHILCNNENGNIAVGDYICTSSTSGEGMKATSICTTIGIAREAITFSNSTAVLVAVEYGYRQFVPEDLEARIVALENA
jgi:hypothetical protein